jgi:hypothetical protein
MQQLQQLIQSNYFVGIVTILGVLFISLARPPLPPAMIRFFELPIITIAMYALIILLLTQNLQVAIIVSIAFYVLMIIIREQKIGEGFVDGLREEGFFSQLPQDFNAIPSAISPDLPYDSRYPHDQYDGQYPPAPYEGQFPQGPYDIEYKQGLSQQLPRNTTSSDPVRFPPQYLSAQRDIKSFVPQYDQTII